MIQLKRSGMIVMQTCYKVSGDKLTIGLERMAIIGRINKHISIDLHVVCLLPKIANITWSTIMQDIVKKN